ncbi:MAG: DUF1285 domain-containing protein [Rhodospirillales bacterium]|jgi:hypothetical protein|nr:DUF1285 domain-containing protein [Rhodospirillales bacterium]
MNPTPPDLSHPVPAAETAALPVPVEGRTLCGDLGIHIDRNGVWHYRGSPIPRKEMVCLFASTLCRAADGGYWLVTPAEMGRIDVEDAPFLAVELFTAGAGREQVLSFRTNVDEIITLDNDHPLDVSTDPVTAEPSPYVMVRDGIPARLTRSVYYEVVARGLEEKIDGEQFYGVWSAGLFFAIGRLDHGE